MTATHALIFANGEPNDGVMVQRAFQRAGHQASIVAADGGARVAAYFGYLPDVVIGDMDSMPETMLKTLEEGGTRVHRYPQDKDETDLELALLWAAEHDMAWIRIVGSLGNRFDQMLANVYLLALPALAGRDVKLVAGHQAIELMRPGTHTITGEVGDTVSLIPVRGDVRGIRTEQLRYPLRDETLMFGPARGISNILLAERATVSFTDGLVLCIHLSGDPDA